VDALDVVLVLAQEGPPHPRQNHKEPTNAKIPDVAEMLQYCYSGVTVQWCYSGVTVVLQWC
jgi:hypothetical protein